MEGLKPNFIQLIQPITIIFESVLGLKHLEALVFIIFIVKGD